MRLSRARSSGPAASCHMLSSVDCITTMPESEFLVHTAGLQDIEPATNSQRVLERLYNLLAVGEGSGCPLGVIRDRGPRGPAPLDVRFAPKADAIQPIGLK